VHVLKSCSGCGENVACSSCSTLCNLKLLDLENRENSSPLLSIKNNLYKGQCGDGENLSSYTTCPSIAASNISSTSFSVNNDCTNIALDINLHDISVSSKKLILYESQSIMYISTSCSKATVFPGNV
jgi:hypothetical protein